MRKSLGVVGMLLATVGTSTQAVTLDQKNNYRRVRVGHEVPKAKRTNWSEAKFYAMPDWVKPQPHAFSTPTRQSRRYEEQQARKLERKNAKREVVRV